MTRTERQIQAIEKWKASGCRASFVMPTGFGKTRTALTAVSRVISKNPWMKVVIVVPTKVLKDQWEEKLDENNIKADILIMNTAAKKFFDCDFLIIDECQHISSTVLANIFQNCFPKFILGLTATYERLDGLEKFVLDKYAPVCDTVTMMEAEENGWISPYYEYKVLLDVDLTEYNEANKTFMSNFAFFDFVWDDFMNCVTNAIFRNKYAKYKGVSVKDVTACAFACNRAMQFRKNFIYNHPKKIEIAKLILENRKDSKAITFNGSIKQCQEYGFGYILHSKKSKKENEQLLEEFSKQTSGVLHTSKMADEGLDISGLNLAIITGFNSSQISKRQRLGRVLRVEPNKKSEVFTLILRGTQEDKWFKKSTEGLSYIEINETELIKVLNYEPLINKQKQIQNEEKTFRF